MPPVASLLTIPVPVPPDVAPEPAPAETPPKPRCACHTLALPLPAPAAVSVVAGLFTFDFALALPPARVGVKGPSAATSSAAALLSSPTVDPICERCSFEAEDWSFALPFEEDDHPGVSTRG